MNKTIRELFPAAERYCYLNSAATGPLPKTAVEAVTSQLKDVSENGTLNYNDWLETKKRARELVATMLNVRAEQIAFMRNTSDGISTIANGMEWSEGENIVTFAHEFPANFYAWRRIRDTYGVELRFCPERDGRIDLDEFINLIDANTRLVSISAVQFASGFRADLERIGKAARVHDALLVVDIIQGFGAMPFDLEAQMVDAAAGASHKWLCAPEGGGILYLSDRARERIQPTLVGWVSVANVWDFEALDQEFKPNALAWETGTGAAALFYGLEQSLKILYQAGLKNIEDYLEDLSDYLCELLAGKDYDLISSRAKGEKSQIVCVKHRGGLSSYQIADQLRQENIIVALRGDRLRIASHFFNNREDIERLVGNLP